MNSSENEQMVYTSTLTLDEVAERLKGAVAAGERVLVLTHAKPDGDAFGSVVALVGALRSLQAGSSSKEANAEGELPGAGGVRGVVVPPVMGCFDGLPGSGTIEVWEVGLAMEADLYVIVDTGATRQIEPLDELIAANRERAMIIDHHRSGDIDVPRYVDPRQASCCEVIAELVMLLNPELLGEAVTADTISSEAAIVRDALYIGMATDTGYFRFSNTSANTHQWAARLIDLGCPHAELFSLLENTQRPEKLALMARAVASTQYVAETRGAIMTLRAADFEATGALLEETEGVVNYPLTVASVRACVLLTEQVNADGSVLTRVSFRSSPPPLGGKDDAAVVDVDVAQLAQQFGGGGHIRAAGAKVDGPFDETVHHARDALINVIESQV